MQTASANDRPVSTDDLISLDEAASLLQTSRRTVYRMVEDGSFQIRHVVRGRQKLARLRRSDVERHRQALA